MIGLHVTWVIFIMKGQWVLLVSGNWYDSLTMTHRSRSIAVKEIMAHAQAKNCKIYLKANFDWLLCPEKEKQGAPKG